MSDKHARIAKAYRDGLPVREIRESLQCSAGTIRLALKKYGLEIRRPTIGRWTDEMKEAVRKLWVVDGLSASQIGAEMGFSREAIIGVVHRGGWKRPEGMNIANRSRTRKLNGLKASEKRPTAKKRKPPTSSPVGTVHHLKRRDEPKATAHFPGLAPNSTPKPWTAREPNECTWPVSGEGADTYSCCAPIVHGTSWCSDHNATGRTQWGGKGYSQAPEQYAAYIVRRCA